MTAGRKYPDELRSRGVRLVFGFPQTHLMWRYVAVHLVERHTVICPDPRGYGDSDKSADDGST